VFVWPLAFPALAVADVVDFAASLIGRPYVWGAEGPRSFDCSGLTQYVYREFGVELPRRAISQSSVGGRASRLQRGDLIFFSSEPRESTVTHVGIYEGGGVMIDASKRQGRVTRDDLNEPFWAERFLFARRLSDGGGTRERDPVVRTTRRAPNRRETVTKVIETLGEILLRRHRR
jgi:cell wall-associated NlpC family hydrolase